MPLERVSRWPSLMAAARDNLREAPRRAPRSSTLTDLGLAVGPAYTTWCRGGLRQIIAWPVLAGNSEDSIRLVSQTNSSFSPSRRRGVKKPRVLGTPG